MRLKTFFVFLALGTLSVLAYSRRESFVAARAKIVQEKVTLMGAKVKNNQKKRLGLQGKRVYEVEVGRALPTQELTSYDLDFFILEYFIYQDRECLYQLIYKEKTIVDNTESLFCVRI